MPLNLIPRNITLTIGGENYTPYFRSFSGSDSRADTSGLVVFTGSLVIQNPSIELNDAFDVIANPGNYQRGTEVLIKQNGSIIKGGLKLYILKPPCPSLYSQVGQGQQLTIELGDRLALNNYKTPVKDVAQSTFGVATPRSTIGFRLLRAAKIFDITSAPIPGSLNYPIPQVSGSVIEQLGKLALAECRCVRDDGSGALDVRRLPIDTDVSGQELNETIYLDPAVDCVEIVPNAGPETPTEECVVTGTTYAVNNHNFTPQVETRYDENGLLVQRVTRAESWDFGSKRRTKTTTTEMLRKNAIPDAVYTAMGTAGPSPNALLVSDYTQEVFQYEAGGERRLLSVTTTKQQPYGVALQSWILNKKTVAQSVLGEITFSLRTVQTSTKTYSYGTSIVTGGGSTTISYSADGVLSQTVETGSKLIAMIAPTVTWNDTNKFNAVTLWPSSRTEQSWGRTATGWIARTDVYKPFVEVNPNAKIDTTLYPDSLSQMYAAVDLTYSTQESSVIESSSGQAQPPASERGPTDYAYQEGQVSGTVVLGRYAASSYANRRQTFQVEYLNGKGIGAPAETPEMQCKRLARFYAKSKVGRRATFRIITDLRNYKPYQRVVVEGIGVFRVESATIAIADNRAVAGFDGYLEGSLRRFDRFTAQPLVDYAPGTTSIGLTSRPKRRIPVGTVFQLGSTTVTLAADLNPEDTTATVEPLPGPIEPGDSAVIEIPVITPPYVETFVSDGGSTSGGNSQVFPYPLVVNATVNGGSRSGGTITGQFIVALNGAANVDFASSADLEVTPFVSDLAAVANIDFASTGDLSKTVLLDGAANVDFTVTGDIAVFSAEPELTAYLSAVSSNGGSVGSTAQNALTAFIVNAKIDGFWTKLNFLWIPLGDYAASAVAVKHSAVNQLVIRVNFVSGDYSEATGYNPGVSNTTKYIDCNMTALAMTGNSTTGSFGLYSHSTFDEAGLSIGASVNSSTSRVTIRPRFTGPDSQTYSEAWDTGYASGGGLQFASEDGSGLWVLNRTSSSNATISRNATTIGTNPRTITSTVPNLNLYIFAGNFAGSVVGHSGRRQSMVFGGTLLTNTDISNMWTRLQTLYSAIGRSL